MFTDPEKNLKFLSLREDMVVADLGAGTGFYSIALGAMVPQGKVYAIEVQKDFLTTVKNKALDAGLKNIECLWGNVEKIGGTQIGDGIVDRVVVSNVLFQIENKDKFIEEVKRILKVGGKVLVIDWSDASSLSPKSDVLVPESKAREMFERKGFVFEQDIDAGAHHYGMILERK
jgi:ubiquinone/menaquinone biosynthesis C-methylase UbiE